jgi:asparagine synthase (glutamine-hydrolysing)
MAGLAGVVALDGSTDERSMELVEQMCDLQTHRGPDDRGVVRLGNLTLGVVRLRIHDLSPAGRQPLHDDREDLWVCLDGDIYNYEAIKHELMAKGQVFRTKTDTEVVLRAYQAWGEQCFDRFLGMFALVLHDRRTGTTTLVRDHFGMKPLNYVVRDRALFFASEYKPLLAACSGTRVNHRALLEWTLYGDVMPPGTLFEGVMSVPPGHLLEIPKQATEPSCRCYYRLLDHIDASRYQSYARMSETGILQVLDQLLQQNVIQYLVGEVPAGIMLSGGVDSAVIAAVAARHRGITGFHLSVPEDPRLDERAMAEEVAKEAGIPLITVAASGEAFRRELATVIRHNEMPLWHMQCVGFHLLAQRAKQEGIKMLLTGDSLGGLMGAETGRHQALKWLTPVRGGLRRLPERYQNAMTKAVYDLKGMPVSSAGFMANFPLAMHLIDGFGRSGLLRECEEAYHFVDDPTARSIMAVRLADQTEWRHRFFHRGDRLAMAASLEYRNPLTDPASVHFAMNLPLEFNLRKGTAKWALKEVATRYLDRKVPYQKKVAWDLPADKYLAPFARLDLFEEGFCAEIFSLPRATIRDVVESWKADLPTFFNLLQIELWGRLLLLGQSPEEITEHVEQARV